MTKRQIILTIISLLLTQSLAQAADVRTFTRSSSSSGADAGFHAIIIEGVIQSGDFEKFRKAIRDGQGKVSAVFLFSEGGDFEEAMKIGRLIRSLEISTVVPAKDDFGNPSCTGGLVEPTNQQNCTCASACFFVHIGGVTRSGLYLAVHRPYYVKGAFGQLSEADAKKAFSALQTEARSYMETMGVPIYLQEEILGTASDSALVLDLQTVETYFLGDIPYRHEWLRNKCSSLTDFESQRLTSYINRARKAGDFHVALSDSEYADLVSLRNKEQHDDRCYISAGREARYKAYETYFK